MKVALRFLLPLVVIAIGYGGMKLLIGSEEESTRRERPVRRLPQVEVVELRRSDFGVTIRSQGVMRPHNSASLTPRVSGRVLKVHEGFEDGAFFKEGDVLLELDAEDFDAAVASAEARVARAEAEKLQEQARADQALLDWRDLGLPGEPSPLVLRVPQMKEADANLKSAEAELLQASRNLERSKVLAPYDGCVMRRLVGPGQSVNPSTTLGEIFSTDYAEVRLPLTAEDLPFLELPSENNPLRLPVSLTDSLDPESNHLWSGEIVRTEGALDATSRELFVIAKVTDPYGLDTDQPALRVGQPVAAQITGKVLKNVFAFPRSSLRNPTEVVTVNPEEFTIERKGIEPVWTDETQVVVRDGLPEGWWIVVSSLALAANGSQVEVVQQGGDSKAAQGPNRERPKEGDGTNRPPPRRRGPRPAG